VLELAPPSAGTGRAAAGQGLVGTSDPGFGVVGWPAWHPDESAVGRQTHVGHEYVISSSNFLLVNKICIQRYTQDELDATTLINYINIFYHASQKIFFTVDHVNVL
jgi:hypothetical protein